MKHFRLFPTHLWEHEVAEKEHLNKRIIKYVLEQDTHKKNWQSKSTMYKLKEFDVLNKNIEHCVETICKTLEYSYDRLEITGMWANVLKPGESHPPHTHSNNFFSGVYYAQSDGGTSIIFADPRQQSQVLLPSKKHSFDNANLLTFPSIAGTMYIFPSWLTHWVPVNNTEHNRISVAWNVILRGEMGSKDEFQYARF